MFLYKDRSSHRRCSVRKVVLRKFAKFTGKHLCQSLFFNKVASLRPVTLLKKRLWHRCFPVNFAKFLRIVFLQNTSGRLLLQVRLKSMLNAPNSTQNMALFYLELKIMPAQYKMYYLQLCYLKEY